MSTCVFEDVKLIPFSIDFDIKLVSKLNKFRMSSNFDLDIDVQFLQSKGNPKYS